MIAGLSFGTSAFAGLSFFCTLLGVTTYAMVTVVADFVRDRRASRAPLVPPGRAEQVMRAGSRQNLKA